jgi:hypothetical protein
VIEGFLMHYKDWIDLACDGNAKHLHPTYKRDKKTGKPMNDMDVIHKMITNPEGTMAKFDENTEFDEINIMDNLHFPLVFKSVLTSSPDQFYFNPPSLQSLVEEETENTKESKKRKAKPGLTKYCFLTEKLDEVLEEQDKTMKAELADSFVALISRPDFKMPTLTEEQRALFSGELKDVLVDVKEAKRLKKEEEEG